MPLYPLALLNRLRSTYWFVPSVITGATVALAMVLTHLDRWYPNSTSWLGWAYGGGASGARALLSAVAGSMVTVVSVTFSVMVVALTVSSQHFGPRLLTNFMRDTPSQMVLGTFTGTFAYCLVVLRAVQGDGGDDYSSFVPHLAVTMAVVLSLLSVGMLIYYVHHVSMSMQVSEITAKVASDLEQAIARMYPDRLGDEAEAPPREPPALPGAAAPVLAVGSGYVQEVHGEALLHLAQQHDTTVWLRARPGDFIIRGTPIADAYPAPKDADGFAAALAGTFVIGSDRTSYQDAAFATQQLVEIALRALSPGMNEPFTAITCIDRLAQGLSTLAVRKIPNGVRADEDGTPRVVTEPRTFAELVEESFEPIALHADRDGAIAARLLGALGLLAGVARRSEDRAAIGRVADGVWTAGTERVKDEVRRARLRREYETVRSRLQQRSDERFAKVRTGS